MRLDHLLSKEKEKFLEVLLFIFECAFLYILKSTMEILTRVLRNNVKTLFVNLFKTNFMGS